MKHVVVVAGGKNSRFGSLSCFPKLLLPLRDEGSILMHDIKTFEGVADVTVVINEMYYDMTKEYVANNNLEGKVKILEATNQNGSANTLKEVAEDLPDKDTFVVWSDLLFGSDLVEEVVKKLEEDKSRYCIFTREGDYRCGVMQDQEGKLQYKDLHNVPGMYYYRVKPSFSYNEKLHPDFDLFDYIMSLGNHLGSSSAISLESPVVEFRDKAAYKRCFDAERLKPKAKTRFFNEITEENGVLTKKCINPAFDHLIENEIDWYSRAKKNGVKCIPKIYETSKEDHFIKMEHLAGYIPMYDFIKRFLDTPEKRKSFFKKYFETVENLHDTEVKEVFKGDIDQDCEIEFFKKVVDRCDKIQHMIVRYDKEKMKSLLQKGTDIIIKSFIDTNLPWGKYCFTHGDLNGSNAMVRPEDEDIKLIDPRGYFGLTRMIGLKEYDFAKILYCCYGYDDFNLNSKWFDFNESEDPEILVKREDLPDSLNKPAYFIMVGIIYVALAQYIAQDIFKANIAYEYGMRLLEKSIKEFEHGEQSN